MTTPLVTILDDEPAIRTMLADALEDAGFRTMCFGRAREFEAALQKHTPDVCLVDSLPPWSSLNTIFLIGIDSKRNMGLFMRNMDLEQQSGHPWLLVL